VLRGYRFGEVELETLPEIRSDSVIKPRLYHDLHFRLPVQVSLGTHVEGMVMPHPDTAHGPTVAAGLAKRVCAQLAYPDPAILVKAREFSRQRVREVFDALPADTELSVEKWLAESNYPLWRREELAAAQRFLPGALPRKYYEFKSFVKSENYPTYKHARTIQAPTDEAKVHFGPSIAACEHVAFTQPFFIKKVPVSERPAYIMEMFSPGVRVAASDFSSFEVSWQRAQMEAFEFPFFEHMFSLMPDGKALLDELRAMEMGRVKLIFKHVTAQIASTRKSGTMNTSLSNGVGNWLVHEFASHHLGLGKLTGIFEGDDGLFYYSSGRFPTPEFYGSLGFSVKLEIHPSIASASFCGMIFDPLERIAVWDPRDFLVRMGWGNGRYARAKASTKAALLRCKALSLAAQTPGCPILDECAQWILRCTRGIDTRVIMESKLTTWWDRERFSVGIRASLPAERSKPGPATRSLVADKFGVSIEEQLAMEDWFSKQTTLCPVPAFFQNRIWQDTFANYTDQLGVVSLDNRPVMPQGPLRYPLILTHPEVPLLRDVRRGLDFCATRY